MGIQKRLVGSYLIVIFITVAILETLLIGFVKYYYYSNIERILLNQAELSASFFQQYFADEELEKQSGRLLNGFSQHSSAQVQIVSRSGVLLQDSTGRQTGADMSLYPDVQEACSGSAGIWEGKLPATGESVLAVSYPLKAHDTTVGVVRFVTSLTETTEAIRQISVIFIVSGLVVIVIVAVLSLLLSRTITGSITKLKQAAEKMAEGDFSVKAEKTYRDELGTLADTLNTMAAKIVQNEKLKSEFIAAVSHELRTPLTSIKGWVVTLQTGTDGGKALLDDGLEIIDAETDRLTQLVDELLDFSKLDNGQMTLNRVPLQLSDLLQHIGKQLSPRAARQNIDLEVRVSGNLPVIYADENRLKQVLINLIDNSLKFTNSGGSIKVHAYSMQGQVIVSVEDNGSGIAENELARVFQKFYRGSGEAVGSGLGLTISEEIIRLHQGRLNMKSELGKGTKVEFCLPYEPLAAHKI
ncbi:HAMP domain-containing histidine kinase [Paenibacillus thalictri]|uniref:histidine kinase n=1 Tax=Paenibacillus thalictri TaxID=2527873 RepID=A0A4V2J3B8_9BACL|nr:HAMP domain-containing histidine kinase [Paenibacillus thalictri]